MKELAVSLLLSLFARRNFEGIRKSEMKYETFYHLSVRATIAIHVLIIPTSLGPRVGCLGKRLSALSSVATPSFC